MERRPHRLRVAVSPIVGGQAVRGPAAKLMAELGQDATSVGVAALYQDLCDVFILDQQDCDLAPAISAMGMEPLVAPTIMNTEADKVRLAQIVLEVGGNNDIAS